MAYDAKAVEIMIASPSDVTEERNSIREIIAEWNHIHSRSQSICLMPVSWETHASPELSGRPQQIINERVLDNADLLIGVFWTRLGTPTGESISGSVEEIERHVRAGKPAMLYFSAAPVVPQSLDRTQYDALTEFRLWAEGAGLIESYADITEFRNKFRRQLQIAVNDSPYIRSLLEDDVSFVDIFEQGLGGSSPLSEDAAEVLGHAASDGRNGMITIQKFLGGTRIFSGGTVIGNHADPRSVARWEAAVEELYDKGFTKDVNGRGEIFKVTNEGYLAAECDPSENNEV